MNPDPLTLPETGTDHVHEWRPSMYPEVMYPGVADWAGTMQCVVKGCNGFRWWTPAEESDWWRFVAADHGIVSRSWLRRFRALLPWRWR